jgi:hypothetical protein
MPVVLPLALLLQGITISVVELSLESDNGLTVPIQCWDTLRKLQPAVALAGSAGR